MSDWIARYQQWPRVYRWILWTVVLVVGYFGVAEPLIIGARSDYQSGDALVQEIHKLSSIEEHTLRKIDQGRELFGPVELASAQGGKRELLDTVRRVLREYDIEPTLESRGETQIKSNNALLEITKAPVEVQFFASPDVLTSVLADLEGEQRVARISSLRIRRERDQPNLNVTMIVEAWLKQEDA
ncbi:MAG: hypothetical protein ACF8PN_02085 [Phycisphaerales bacterium]